MDTQLAILRAAQTAHRFQEWATQPAVEYHGRFSAESFGTAGDAHELSDYGWITTSLVVADGTLASFPDAGWSTLDWGTPGSCGFDAADDLLISPAVLADPMGFLTAAKLMGQAKPPTRFFLEVNAALTTNSANENTSGFGLLKNGASTVVATGHVAFVYSDGTNFVLRANAGTVTVVSTLALVATALWHRFEIDRIAQLLTWSTSADGITYTKRSTLTLTADTFPVSFGAGLKTSSATNRLSLYGDLRAGYI